MLAYGANFLVFHKEPTVANLLIECLPVIGMIATTLVFRHKDAGVIRRYSLVSSCFWLICNITSMSVGAICCEACNVVLIFNAMYRLDCKKVQEKDHE